MTAAGWETSWAGSTLQPTTSPPTFLERRTSRSPPELRYRKLSAISINEYIANAGTTSLDQEAMELYRRWWELADIGVPIELFRRPHERTEHTAASFDNLADSLPKS